MQYRLFILFRLLFSVFFLTYFSASSQQICGELPLYFEDAIGNRDTIILVYGEGFHIDSVYRELGEDSLSFQSSFDNDLTVYISKGLYDSFNPFFSKKAAFGTPDCSKEMPPFFAIFIKCKHPPLKLSWEPENYCMITETNFQTMFWLFNNNFFAFVTDLIQYYDLKTFVVCEDDPEEYFHEPMGSTTSQGWAYEIFREQENDDGNIDSIYMFHGVFDMILVSSVVSPDTAGKSTQVFPNPGTGSMLQIEASRSSIVDFTLYDMNGKVVFFAGNQYLSNSVNEVILKKDLPPGHYMLSIRHRDGPAEWHMVIRN